jgi:2,3-bisphosphoglycerate-independent phosphoglycerate mutase
MKRPIVFIVIDGMPDTIVKGKTPLSEARKPNMNFFAKNGICGKMLTLPEKNWTKTMYASVSHFANLNLLGYNADNYKIKRGVLEALGSDTPFKNGELAVRCNFASVSDDLTLLDRHIQRNMFGLDELTKAIIKKVNVGVKFVFKRTYEHRAVLIIKRKLSDNVTDSDPLSNGLKSKEVHANSKNAEKTAKLLQDFINQSYHIIDRHPVNKIRNRKGILPANYLLLREPGNSVPKLESFPKKYKRKCIAISENGVMKATCKLAGFDTKTVPETDLEKNLDFIFDSIMKSIKKYDFVYAHIKGPDEPAHDGDFDKKKKIIEAIDKEMKVFMEFDGILVITSDHITSTKLKEHHPGPVPVVVFGKDIDNVEKFDEISAKKGKLGLINGKKLLKYVMK